MSATDWFHAYLASLGVGVNTYPTVGFNPDSAVSQLVINGSQVSADVTNAISQAQLDRVLVGASTLTLTVEDPFRSVVNSEISQIVAATAPGAGLAPFAPFEPTTCEIVDPVTGSKLVFSLCQVEKNGDQLQLVFEDFWINAMRYAYASGYMTASGTMTRADFMVQVIRKALPEIPVPVVVVPGDFPQIQTLEQATGDSQWGTSSNPTEDAWTCLTRLANAVQWRCFSNGNAIIIGPDEWLLSYPVARTFVENTGGVDSIDFSVDLQQGEATLTVNATTQLLTFPPGAPIQALGLGIASTDTAGKSISWLVSDISRSLFVPDATIQAVRPQSFITEDQLAASSSSSPSPSPNGTPSAAASSAVNFALAQLGKPYLWGGRGPEAYDCSGLVYTAYRQAGITIPPTSQTQWFQITNIVDISQLLPGDLVFYNMNEQADIPGPGHVVMYIGDGQVVEAPHTGTVVFKHAIDPGYVGARRPAP